MFTFEYNKDYGQCLYFNKKDYGQCLYFNKKDYGQCFLKSKKKYMFTPKDIKSAVKSGDKVELECILSSNIFKERAALFEAIDVGQYEIFSMLFQKNSQKNSQSDIAEFSSNLLDRAAASVGNPEIFRCLLDKASTLRFDINMKTIGGRTLLMIAAFRGNSDICSILLEKGAEIDLLDRNDESALYHAVENGHLEVCQLLLHNGAKYSPDLFERAIIKGYPKICSFLLDEGIAEISLPSYNILESSFGLAVYCGHLEICEILFAHGVSLDYQDYRGDTFLHLACREKKLEIAKFIVERMKSEIALSLNCDGESVIQVWGGIFYSSRADQDIED